MELQPEAAALVGAVVPLLVQLIRVQLLPKLDKRASYLLALGVALGCTVAAYLKLDPTPTWKEFLPQVGAAFGLSQLVYGQLEASLKNLVGDPE